MKKAKVSLLFCAVAAVAAVVATAAFKPLGVETISIAPSTVKDTFTEKGVVERGKSVTVISEVSGPIETILVSENTYVEAGDTIAVIDSAQYQYEKASRLSAILAYEAQISEALNTSKLSDVTNMLTPSPDEYLLELEQNVKLCKSNYNYAKQNYEALNTLYEEVKGASKASVEEAQIAMQSAETALEQAEKRLAESTGQMNKLNEDGSSINDIYYGLKDLLAADAVNRLQAIKSAEETAVEQLEDRISKCILTAPVAGYITAIPASELTYMQAGQTAAVISTQDRFTVSVDVLTENVPYLQEGDSVTIIQKLKAGDESYSGTITEISPTALPSLSSLGLTEYRVNMKIQAASDTPTLKDGYEVKVEFTSFSKDNLLSVPNSALFETDRGKEVFVHKDGKAHSTPVETGYRTGLNTVIESGLSVGDVIIVNADTEGLADGVRVSCKNN